jgi:hypothetical protein
VTRHRLAVTLSGLVFATGTALVTGPAVATASVPSAEVASGAHAPSGIGDRLAGCHWIKGHWARIGGRNVWVSGHRVCAPRGRPGRLGGHGRPAR